MSWREATTTFDASGFHLFQSGWVDNNGNLVAFSDNGNDKIEKYVRDDYLQLGYKKIESPIMFFSIHTNPGDFWNGSSLIYSSTDGKDFSTLTCATSATSLSGNFMHYVNNAIYFNGRWIVPVANSATQKGKIYNTTDFSTFSESLSSSYISYPISVAGSYIWTLGNETPNKHLYRSSDGISFVDTGYTTGDYHSQYNMVYFDGKYIFPTNGGGLAVSSDNGATFTEYTPNLYSDYSAEIKYIEVRGAYLYMWITYGVAGDFTDYSERSAYITEAPSASDFTYTQIMNGGHMGGFDGYAYSKATLSVSNILKNGTKTFIELTNANDSVKEWILFPYFYDVSSVAIGKTQIGFYNKKEDKFYSLVYESGYPNEVYELIGYFNAPDKTSDFTLPSNVDNYSNINFKGA